MSFDAGDAFIALIYAARAGNADRVEALLGAGIDPNVRVKVGNTPHTALINAAHMGQYECMRLLLAAGADPTIKLDYTALVGAVEGGHVKCALALLEAGAQDGPFALECAAAMGQTECVATLVDFGVDLGYNNHGRLGLKFAIADGHDACAEILLLAGVTLDGSMP